MELPLFGGFARRVFHFPIGIINSSHLWVLNLGCFLKVSPASLNKINFWEDWLKVDVYERVTHPHEIVAKFREGTCSIKAEILSLYEARLRVFTGSFSACLSIESCCAMSADMEAVASAPVLSVTDVASPADSVDRVGLDGLGQGKKVNFQLLLTLPSRSSLR